MLILRSFESLFLRNGIDVQAGEYGSPAQFSRFRSQCVDLSPAFCRSTSALTVFKGFSCGYSFVFSAKWSSLFSSYFFLEVRRRRRRRHPLTLIRLPELGQLGVWLLTPLCPWPKVELVVVMVIVPLLLNTLYCSTPNNNTAFVY